MNSAIEIRMNTFDVFRPCRNGVSKRYMYQDTVYFLSTMTLDEVRRSLIDHDGFSDDIVVVRHGVSFKNDGFSFNNYGDDNV